MWKLNTLSMALIYFPITIHTMLISKGQDLTYRVTQHKASRERICPDKKKRCLCLLSRFIVLDFPELVFWMLLKRKQKSERHQKCSQFNGKFMCFPISGQKHHHFG